MIKEEEFTDLVPEMVLEAAESIGERAIGSFELLHGLENRVFSVPMESNKKLIVKFYRPSRWNEKSHKEVNEFVNELSENDLPVVNPLAVKNKELVGECNNFYYCVFPFIQSQGLYDFFEKDYEKLGEILAQIHNVGASRPYKNRAPFFNLIDFENDLNNLKNWVPPEYWGQYEEIALEVSDELSAWKEDLLETRIHGDFHRGNFLNRRGHYTFIDFDESSMGPCIQDFWMMIPDPSPETEEFEAFIKGYKKFRAFNIETYKLIPWLRAFRIIKFSIWIGQRWHESRFKNYFDRFESYSYWQEELRILDEILLINES